MRYRDKLKLARKIQTTDELKVKGKGVFQSAEWEKRKNAIAERISKHEK